MKKGFPPGKKVHWDFEVLETLHEMLSRIAPDAQFVWGNKQIVPVFLEGQKNPWASIQTKKCDAVWLHLTGPSGGIPLGRIADIGQSPSVRPSNDSLDVAKIGFVSVGEIQTPEFETLLQEHYGNVQNLDRSI